MIPNKPQALVKPSQPKTHFLPRKLVLFRDDENVLKKARLKGLSITNILELNNDIEDIPWELNKYKYLKGKATKTLRKAEFNNFSKLNWLNTLKYARCLKDISIEVGSEDLLGVKGFLNIHEKIKYVIQSLKKLSKGIKTIELNVEGLSVKHGDVVKIYKFFASLRDLTSCSRLLGFNIEECYVEHEYKLIERYLGRLPKLKEFDYDYWRYDKSSWDEGMLNVGNYSSADQKDFQSLVKKGKGCPWITTMGINIVGEYLTTQDAAGQPLVFKKEESDDEQEDEKEEKKEEDEKIKKGKKKEEGQFNEALATELKAEIMLFYRFDLFPHLKKLDFQLFDDCLHPLDCDVVEAFKALKSLEHLEITLEDRPVGASYIFEGLLKLPLLKSFSLETLFLKNMDWRILSKFFKHQPELESISLNVSKKRGSKERYFKQNEYVEHLWQFFTDKPKLAYLQIALEYCPLESLSTALGHLKFENQLKLLTIEAMDDMATSTKSSMGRVEGLCSFVRRQKGSLRYLKMNLPFVVDVGIIEPLTSAISELHSLKELELNINAVDLGQKKYFFNFFENTLKKGNLAKTMKKHRKSYYPQITKMLQDLENLDDVNLHFGGNKQDQQSINEFLEMMEALSSMKSLRNVEFNIPFNEVSIELVEKIKPVLLGMRNVSFLEVDTDDLHNDDISDLIDDIVSRVNKRQCLRSDLMF